MNTQFETIMEAIIREKPATKAEFDRARQNATREHKINLPANRHLLEAYQNLVKKKRIAREPALEQFLRKANIRSGSGIAVITSLVKPYMCPGKCVYCPTEIRMPKSYIASEPAAARSLRLNFDPYELMHKRIDMLEKNGHPCDKIEYIVKGGTWNAYPLKYQYWYMLESFRACNNLARRAPTSRTHEADWGDVPLEALMETIEQEQRYNETARHRIIGATLETRPDAISPKTIMHMRKQGCTRIELGLQAPDDDILALIKRGHTVDQFRTAITLLRQAGFKVDLHFMPDLPGTTPEHDVAMYKLLFEDKALRPDMVKIYPNTVIKSAEQYQWFLEGKYKPYGEENLFNALLQMKLATPPYCRISRLIRDIPADEIEAGNKITNLREALAKELQRCGLSCQCLRCREIGRHRTEIPEDTAPQLFTDTYETRGGTEYFLTFEDPKRIAVFAFLRLRLPHAPETTEARTKDASGTGPANASLHTHLPEIRDCAFIRELHTYGQMVGIGERRADAAQHKGLGKQLMQEAQRIAHEHEFKKLAVISGVGVRGYYRKLGFAKRGTYMVKVL